MFALNQFPALSFGFPDVCLTPAGLFTVPVPYPNTATESLGFPFPLNIFVGGSPVHNMATVIGSSMGDLPGIAGMASGAVLGPAFAFLNSNTCLMGGLPTKRVTSFGSANFINAASMAAVPNQLKVLVLAP